METAQSGRIVDVAVLLDERKLTPFNIKLIMLSWLITLFDGFDQMMVSFTGPYMIDELHLTKMMFATIVSSGTTGMVAGSILFSFIGDKIGRRPTIIGTAFLFGFLTLATASATTFAQLVALRFVDGLAIGGMLPLAWALNIEYVPKRIRTTVVTVIMFGFSAGSAVAGPMTNLIAPTHGWQGVYIAGGIGTLICAAGLALTLPESIRFLITRGRPAEQIAATLHRLDPRLSFPANSRFVLADETKKAPAFPLAELFAGRLRFVTPLVWLSYMASSLAIYFSATWGPKVLEELDVPRHTAALVSSLGGLSGAFAGMAIMYIADKRGPRVIGIYPALAIPALLLLGLGLLPGGLFFPFVVLSTLLIGGQHSAVIAMCGAFYPTRIRGSGAGCAAAIGKVGGVLAPIGGAALLTSGIPVLRSYALLAACPAVLLVCILAIAAIVRGPELHPVTAVPNVVPAS